jgi:D-glycero-alpha-D-manno-heptose-7-phosphate kinase
MSSDKPKIIRCRAPLRISFGGGGTDVSPYCDERGGRVLNATINRYAYVTLVPNDRGRVRLHSLDFDQSVEYDADSDVPDYDDNMDLAKGVIRRLQVDELRGGFDLYTHADCPPGSGLGASSTMVVALMGAFDAWLKLGLSPYDMARTAFEIERVDLGIHGGRQDQYTATFGGFNFMEFEAGKVLVNPLRISPEAIAELEYSLVLAYTGSSRHSSKIIETQMQNYSAGATDAIEAMDRTKELASELKEELLRGNYRGFGQLLHEAWMHKKRMSDRISNPVIEKLYEAARNAGALGGKISGAGGGGFMYFFTEFDRRHQVEEALRNEGAEVVYFGFTDEAVRAWDR